MIGGDSILKLVLKFVHALGETSTFTSRTDNKPVICPTSPNVFSRDIRVGKDGPLFCPATFNGTRGNAAFVTATGVCLDFDKGQPTPEAILAIFPGKLAWLYSTHSHTAEKPHYRVVLPLSRPVDAAEHALLRKGVLEAIPEELVACLDITCLERARAHYLPSCPPDQEGYAVLRLQDGASLDVEAMIAIGKETPTKEEIKSGTRADSNGNRPGDDYVQRHSITELLQAYNWKHVRGDYWLRPNCDTGSGHSAKVYNGGVYVYSSNAPVPSGFHDAFSFFTHTLHGGDFFAAARALAEKGYGERAHQTGNPTKTEVDPLDAAVLRLAKLTPMQYDQVRKKEAEELSVRTPTLDEAVNKARNVSNPVADQPYPAVEPWPDKIDPGELLTIIVETIQRFIVCTSESAVAAALWIAMTWFIDVAQVAPLLLVTAPEKRCGKTLMLSLLGKLVARPLPSSNITPAALFRTVDQWGPTLLIDEADSFLKTNEELRGLINSGHTRDSAFVIRVVGDSFTPTRFSTWGAKAIAGIGHVADTIMDRAVIMELRRKLPHEEVERLRHAEPEFFDDLRAKLARFAEDYSEKVRNARPILPASLNDRAQDNWEPLLAIADVAGKGWPEIGRTAALKLSEDENVTQSIGTVLLSDIRDIFGDKKNHIFTVDLIASLCAEDEKPWATYNKGFEIKPYQIAKRLAEYGIKSKNIRVGTAGRVAKGYDRSQFKEAFDRYLTTSEESATSATPLPSSSNKD